MGQDHHWSLLRAYSMFCSELGMVEDTQDGKDVSLAIGGLGSG